MKKFKGAITALATPFKENKSIDILAFKKFIEFQIKSGVDGIVPAASTGEAATMTLSDYELVLKTAVSASQKRAPVIAGASHNNTAYAVELSKIAKKAGVNALLHTNPYYNKPTLSGLIAHFKEIAKVGLPIIIYNVPGRTGANMSADTTIAIAKAVPEVVGIKEATGDMNQVTNIVKGVSDDFSVLSGDDATTLPLMSLGGAGCISVVANEIPKEFTQMIHFAMEGDFESARLLHYEWLDLMNANFIESNPIPVKTALSAMGYIKEVFRLPLTEMSPKNKEAFMNIVKKHKLV